MKKHIAIWNKILFMILLVMMVISSSLILYDRGIAQDADQIWSEPVNLSQSGSTDSPVIIIDSTGVVHVAWLDEFAGSIYTSLQAGQWTAPTSVELPFFQRNPFQPNVSVGKTLPELLLDSAGYIHAFWFHDDGSLRYSRVRENEFGIGAAWLAARKLLDSAINFDVVVDSLGGLHLVYVLSEESPETPAGVYYQRSADGGFSWTSPTLLYENRYFRSLTGDQAHLDISTTEINGVPEVIVAWDDRPLKRTYLIKSIDAGVNWQMASLIDSPITDQSVNIPFQLTAYPKGQDVLLFWHSRVENSLACNHYYQFSTNGGETWSDRQQFLSDDFSCPIRSIVFPDQNGNAILWLEFEDNILLLAWDGNQWSEAQDQVELNSFPDPGTFSTVIFQCRQPALSSDGQLSVVGCDRGFGADIWLRTRRLSDTSGWYPFPSKWSVPLYVSNEEIKPISPALNVDKDGIAHILWNQRLSAEANQNVTNEAIYYGRIDSDGWLASGDVITSPKNKVSQPSVTIDGLNRLLAVWSEGQFGDIYFSWAVASMANNPSEWITPIQLPSLRAINTSPQILSYGSENVIVAYAIPVNEDRGIYITRSTNAGETWSDPARIVDASSQEWDRVDHPKLARTVDGRLHALWTRFDLINSNLSEGNPAALYYVSSDDNGETWSEPQEVVSATINWSDIVSPDGVEVHRLWQEVTGNSSVLWHEFSVDGGSTWSRTSVLSSTGVENEFLSLTPDPSGALHFLRITRLAEDTWLLGYWQWNGESWSILDDLELATAKNERIIYQDSAYDPKGYIAVGYSTWQEGEEGDEYGFTFIQRTLNEASTVDNSITITPTSAPLTTVTPPQLTETQPTTEVITGATTAEPNGAEFTPSPAAAENTAIPAQNNPQAVQDNTTMGIIVSIIIAIIVVGLGISVRLLRRHRV